MTPAYAHLRTRSDYVGPRCLDGEKLISLVKPGMLVPLSSSLAASRSGRHVRGYRDDCAEVIEMDLRVADDLGFADERHGGLQRLLLPETPLRQSMQQTAEFYAPVPQT